MRRKLCAFLIVLVSSSLIATVYLSYGSDDAIGVIERLGGELISNETVLINGESGRFSVYGLTGNTDHVSRGMQTFGGDVQLGNMVRWQRENETVLFLPMRESSLVFIMQQKNRATQPTYPESLPMLDGLSVSLSLEKKNLSFVSGTLPYSKDEAQRLCRNLLEDAGFYELVRGGMVFVRGKHSVTVGISPRTNALYGVNLIMLRLERQMK